MEILNPAETALKEARRRDELRREAIRSVLHADRVRQAAAEEERRQGAASHRTRRCPGCGSGIKMKWMATGTLLVCPACSWTRFLENVFEGRPMSESYVPGVDGIPRGRVVFKLGKIHV